MINNILMMVQENVIKHDSEWLRYSDVPHQTIHVMRFSNVQDNKKVRVAYF